MGTYTAGGNSVQKVNKYCHVIKVFSIIRRSLMEMS
jgi:hypothetical protein